MSISRSLAALASTLALASLLQSTASAQFGFPGGFMNLPSNDFTWTWGDSEDALVGRGRDISVRSNDQGFDCTLTAALRGSRGFSITEIRELEQQLRTSMDFIYYSANTMYSLEQQFALDWGMLDCAKPVPTPDSEEEAQQKLDRALEKARREQAQRRERRERQEARENAR